MKYNNNGIKFDTVFRASIGFISDLGPNITSFHRSFLQETIMTDPKIINVLNTKQILKIVSTADSHSAMLNTLKNEAAKTEITSQKANILKLFRDHKNTLNRLGISNRKLIKFTEEIEKSCDSEIINKFCVPLTKLSLMK